VLSPSFLLTGLSSEKLLLSEKIADRPVMLPRIAVEASCYQIFFVILARNIRGSAI
jgi:hypothetical protein